MFCNTHGLKVEFVRMEWFTLFLNCASNRPCAIHKRQQCHLETLRSVVADSNPNFNDREVFKCVCCLKRAAGVLSYSDTGPEALQIGLVLSSN